jgi:hypothetical protein
MNPESAPPSKKPAPKPAAPKKAAPPKDTVFREGMPVPQDIDGRSVKKMAKGGSASSRADGCATKGKTKGKMITMKNGGMC